MNLKGILSISGKPGLYRMISNKPSGLIVEPLGGGARLFAASRQHQFTPVESIAIFTDDGDSVPIREVLGRMHEQIGDNALPDAKASSETFREYLLDVLPNHDRERVYVSDIKKLVRWYEQLDAAGAITAPDPEDESSSEDSGDAAVAKTGGEASADADGPTSDPEDKPAGDRKSAADKKPATDKKSGSKKSGGARPAAGAPGKATSPSRAGASKAGGKRKV